MLLFISEYFELHVDYWNADGQTPKIAFDQNASSPEVKIDFKSLFNGQTLPPNLINININSVRILDENNTNYEISEIFLPVGISFYTFQTLSYSIDIYRGKLTPERNILNFAFFVTFFPQLVAGPIVRASEFLPQLRSKLKLSNHNLSKAVFLIGSGLFKKAIISDYISVNYVDRIFDNPLLYSGVENLIGVYAYALQIYCDFSGYSDMAIGLALLLGFYLPINFDSPYKSSSITEFWRRWHISLSSWLKYYLYISLG